MIRCNKGTEPRPASSPSCVVQKRCARRHPIIVWRGLSLLIKTAMQPTSMLSAMLSAVLSVRSRHRQAGWCVLGRKDWRPTGVLEKWYTGGPARLALAADGARQKRGRTDRPIVLHGRRNPPSFDVAVSKVPNYCTNLGTYLGT